MDDQHLADLLETVQVDLTDGQDLALAAQLVGDALRRRVRRVRDTLERLRSALEEVEGGSASVREHVAGLSTRTDEFEDEMGRIAARLASVAKGYEAELQVLADRVRDVERDA